MSGLDWGVPGFGDTQITKNLRQLLAAGRPPHFTTSVVSLGKFQVTAMATTPIADLLQLPMGERLALAMALWDSLDEEGRNEALPLDADLCNELDRRWADYRQNPQAAIPWEQIRGQLGLG